MSQDFPFLWVVNGKQDITTFIDENISSIKDKLHKHGVIMFRGLDVDDQDKLETVVAAYPGQSMDYVDGNSPRTKLEKKGVYLDRAPI